jgi:hypothetical protein
MTPSIELQPWDAKPIKHAWPGGHPVFYVCRAGYRNGPTGELEFSSHDRAEFICCPDCVGKGQDQIAMATGINWEDPFLLCAVCSQRIESAYAEPEVAP